MIVLKATQDQILSVLQSIAGIVERRHTLPILAKVLLRNADGEGARLVGVYVPNKIARAAATLFRPVCSQLQRVPATGHFVMGLKSFRQGLIAIGRNLVGFFSSSKANLRNAP